MEDILVVSFIDDFNAMKSVHCMCPHCSGISRLSDLRLKSKKPAPKTWLDTYEQSIEEYSLQESKFIEEKSKIKARSVARGRARVPSLISQSLDPGLAKLQYNPYDIKAILHPIDFVVFNGMNDDSMSDVVLLSKRTENKHLQRLHRGIESAVSNKNYDWKVLRVSSNGDVEYE